MLTTLLVGGGLSARAFHYPFVQTNDQYQPVGIVRTRTEPVEGIDLPVFTSLTEALAATQPALVILATPNALHKAQTIEALRAGAHVVVDKPLAITRADGEEMFRVAQEVNRLLTAFQNRRWDADLQTIRKLIQENTLGKIVRFESRFDRYRPKPKGGWREENLPGSGIWYDLGSHLLDQAIYLFGKPEAITASIRRERTGMPIDDAFDAWLHYADKLVVVGASTLVAANQRRFAVMGQSGSYIKYGLDPQEAALRSGILPGSQGFGEEAAAAFGMLTTASANALAEQRFPSERGNYAAFYNQLAEAITVGKPSPVAAEDTLLQLQLLEAGQRSQGARISLI